MATAIVRSGLRSALRGGASAPRASPASRRSFASSAHHDEAAEASKWEKITYVAIATCTILSIYNLSKGHPHHEEPPPYPYLHIRNKEFPWGETFDGLISKWAQIGLFGIIFEDIKLGSKKEEDDGLGGILKTFMEEFYLE